jgi:cellulose synthase/poly-beta-1,6-N-acetylglucosamine synthase-like glycosyltransferase
MIWYDIISGLLSYGIFFYSIFLLSFYLFIAIYSIGETIKHLRKNSFTDFRVLAASPLAPSVSIIAPAYNEGPTIIENVKSLLSIFYINLEVIVINDGSSDDSLQKLISAYELELTDHFVIPALKSKPIKGIYKSSNPLYKKLIVIDKVNGGKADALNAAINIAANDYIVSIDVDCILEQDALLKIVKPLMDDNSARVIASGGVVRIANSCEIEDGNLVKVKLPKKYLPRVQTLEYIRAFLFGRMAWTRLNGLLLISGAFGAFDKSLVIRCGGYNTNTVGEDMELVVRMRRYMQKRKEPYSVKYIPDPLCWTEAPTSYKVLGRQRNRWMRGTMETLWAHKTMFFNPRYGLMGMISFPYWVFFEMLAPAVEFLGLLSLVVMIFTGLIQWKFFLAVLYFIICFGLLYSSFALLMEVMTYHQYKRRIDIMKLLMAAISEPFLFHPFVMWSSIRGIVDYFRKKKDWGDMTREGFDTTHEEIKKPVYTS